MKNKNIVKLSKNSPSYHTKIPMLLTKVKSGMNFIIPGNCHKDL